MRRLLINICSISKVLSNRDALKLMTRLNVKVRRANHLSLLLPELLQYSLYFFFVFCSLSPVCFINNACKYAGKSVSRTEWSGMDGMSGILGILGWAAFQARAHTFSHSQLFAFYVFLVCLLCVTHTHNQHQQQQHLLIHRGCIADPWPKNLRDIYTRAARLYGQVFPPIPIAIPRGIREG